MANQYIENLFHFYETSESYNNHMKQGVINPDSICFLKETGQVATQGNVLGISTKDYASNNQELISKINTAKDAIDNIASSGIAGTVNITVSSGADTLKNSLDNSKVGDMKYFLITDSKGVLPSLTGETYVTACSDVCKLFAVSTLGASVGDLVVCAKVKIGTGILSVPVNVYRVIPLNDVKASSGDFPGAQGLSTPWDKSRINMVDSIKSTADSALSKANSALNYLPSKSESNMNNCLTTGVYPWCTLGRPANSEWNYTLFVTRSTTADSNGYYTVEQTAYGRGAGDGKIYKRIIFDKSGDQQFGEWVEVSSIDTFIKNYYKIKLISFAAINSDEPIDWLDIDNFSMQMICNTTEIVTLVLYYKDKQIYTLPNYYILQNEINLASISQDGEYSNYSDEIVMNNNILDYGSLYKINFIKALKKAFSCPNEYKDYRIIGENIKVTDGILSVPVATKDNNGVMSAADKAALDKVVNDVKNIQATDTTVPVATTSTAGIVKVGTNITVANDGTISIPAATTSKSGAMTAGDKTSLNTAVSDISTLKTNVITLTTDVTELKNKELPVASEETAGIIKVGEGLKIEDGVLSVDGTVSGGNGDNTTEPETPVTPSLQEDIANAMSKGAYGVSWTAGQVNSKCTRTGFSEKHRTLPIQNKMVGVLYDPVNGTEVCELNPNDWMDTEYYKNKWIKPQSDNVCNIDIFDDNVFKIAIEDTGEFIWDNVSLYDVVRLYDGSDYRTAVITSIEDSYIIVQDLCYRTPFSNSISITAIQSICNLAGSDGHVVVRIPEFWIKSWTNNSTEENTVLISDTYIDNTWEHQESFYIGAYPASEIVSKEEEYTGLLNMDAGTLVTVMNPSKDLSSSGSTDSEGENAIEYYSTCNPQTFWIDNYQEDPFGTIIRMPEGTNNLTYGQYKNLYWLYVIEYANFASEAEFIEGFDANGYKQGGLGVDTSDDLHLPNGITNHLGNNTGIVKLSLPFYLNEPQYDGDVRAVRWRGIENFVGRYPTIFEDVYFVHNSSHTVMEMYKREVGREDNVKVGSFNYTINNSDTKFDFLSIASWNLGNSAELLPLGVVNSDTVTSGLNAGVPRYSKFINHDSITRLLMGGSYPGELNTIGTMCLTNDMNIEYMTYRLVYTKKNN